MRIRCNAYLATLWQVLIALVLLWLTRFAFYYYNADVIGRLDFSRLMSLSLSGLIFDISATAYANALFILMRFLPFRFTMKRGWRIAEMIVYGICNSVMLIVQIGDIPFFRFNGGRLRLDGFLSLMNTEMVGVTFGYAGQYWWAFLGIAAVIGLMMWLATRIEVQGMARRCWVRTCLFVIALTLTFFGMRGSLVHRPIGIDTAGAYIKEPGEINVVLNTPFCVIRSANYSKGMATRTFYDDEKLASLRSSLQNPAAPLAADSIKLAVKGKNIMLIILESGGQIWFDSLSDVAGGNLRGHAPFLSSIAAQSFAITNTFCTGNRTVEGLASIIGGVPTFGALNWMATNYATLKVDAPAHLLADNGYSTKFFLGARYEPFALGALANVMGFSEVVSKEKIDLTDKGNTNIWGIYDHVMAPYVARQITASLPQPFFAAWLTLDLHSPFDVPEGKDFTTDDPMLRGVEYMDYSIKCFFDEARKQPWFDNTLFVITADHGFRDLTEAKYNGAYIYAHVPFLLYTPDGSLAPGRHADRPMAQFDIPVTLLWLAGYDKPHVAIGTNWFDDTKPHYGVQLRNDMWQLTGGRYHVRMPYDAGSIDAVFDITADPELLTPLNDYDTDEVNAMTEWFRALLQDYTTRANTSRLTATAQ